MNRTLDTDRIVVGLDIGTTKVVAVVGKHNEYGQIDVLGIGTAKSEGVERGQVVNINKTIQAIKQAVAEAEQHSNVEIGVVTVGIAGDHIRSFNHKGIITLNNPDAEITHHDLERLRNDMYKVSIPAGQRILHVIAQEYAVDDRKGIKDPVGISGVRLEGNFQLVTASENAYRTMFRVLEGAGLEMEGIVLESIASSYACLQPDEKQEGVALVDIGGGTTDVCVWENGFVRHTATIPFGGNIITQDIRTGCLIMERQAEVLKTQYGSAMANLLDGEEILSISSLPNRAHREISNRTLARIIQARMEEIAEMVALEIKQSGVANHLVGGIVLTGGGAYLKHCDKLMEYVTGHSVRIGHPTEKLAKGLVEEVRHPMYATATGLVAYALEQPDSAEPVEAATQKRTRGAFRLGGGTGRAGEGSILGGFKKFFEKAIDGSPVE